MITKKSWVFSLAALAAVIAIVGIAWVMNNTEVNDLPTITLGYRPTVAVDLAILKAIEQKGMEKQGLRIVLKPYGNAITLFAGLKSGEIDGSLGVPLEPVLGMRQPEGGYPVKAYLVWYFDKNVPYDGFLVKKDSAAGSLEDLEGKRIGSHPSRQVTYFVTKMVQNAQVRTYNPASPLLPLKSGDVDAVYVLEPFLSKGVASGEFRILESASIAKHLFDGKRVPAAISLLSSSWVAQNPELAEKFVTSARAVYSQARQSSKREDYVKLLQLRRYGSFSKEVASTVCEPSSSLPEEMSSEELQAFVNALKGGGLSGGDLNYDELFYIPAKKLTHP